MNEDGLRSLVELSRGRIEQVEQRAMVRLRCRFHHHQQHDMAASIRLRRS